MDLGFAGLHQLLVPFLDGLDRLPAPQRAALESAFGLAAGPPPDRFLVGLATLTLLTDAAASLPVLCVVDNAQWLDRASAEVLGFVARRLLADRVGMLFAVREGERTGAMFSGLPELAVTGLADHAARELLAAAAAARWIRGLASGSWRRRQATRWGLWSSAGAHRRGALGRGAALPAAAVRGAP